MQTLRLIDVDAMRPHLRATFMMPSSREREAIRPGDYIKIGFIIDDRTGRDERLWLKVSIVDGQSISGFLENDPIYLNASRGDLMQLELRHVLAIERAGVAQR